MTKPTKKKPTGKMIEQLLPIDELVPNPRNPRRHPEEQLLLLRASVRTFGQPRPVLARAANKMLIAGHGIQEAMRAEGEQEIRVILWDIDQKTADAFMLADNKLAEGGRDDPAMIRELLAEIDKAELEAVGFGADEAAEILDGLEKDDIAVREIETSEVEDRFWISIRGPLASQAEALKRLKDAMAGLGEVDVELGTTAFP